MIEAMLHICDAVCSTSACVSHVSEVIKDSTICAVRILGAGGCLVVIAQCQSTGSSSQVS